MFGIDCASVDHNEIDWAELKRGGKSFAVVRAAYGMKPDADFPRFWPAIREAGLVRGAYLFSRPAINDPEEEVRQFLEIVGPLGPGDLPPVIDLERPRWDTWDPPLVLQRVRHIIDVIKREMGTPPMIYTSRRVWRDELGDPPATGFAECPLWICDWGARHYRNPRLPSEWGDVDYWIHQFAGDTQNIPGVSKQADMNKFNLLYIGEEGPRARWLNQRLGLAGDVFDEETLQAVKQFQRDQRLQTDGIVGPWTWTHLIWTR
jgi:lysozyme